MRETFRHGHPSAGIDPRVQDPAYDHCGKEAVIDADRVLRGAASRGVARNHDVRVFHSHKIARCPIPRRRGRTGLPLNPIQFVSGAPSRLRSGQQNALCVICFTSGQRDLRDKRLQPTRYRIRHRRLKHAQDPHRRHPNSH